MKFNSAARVAGARDSGGRTIRGVVLRYNTVTGRSSHETGLTYAVVEFTAEPGKVRSLAVGLSAEGMDIAYLRTPGMRILGETGTGGVV